MKTNMTNVISAPKYIILINWKEFIDFFRNKGIVIKKSIIK